MSKSFHKYNIYIYIYIYRTKGCHEIKRFHLLEKFIGKQLQQIKEFCVKHNTNKPMNYILSANKINIISKQNLYYQQTKLILSANKINISANKINISANKINIISKQNSYYQQTKLIFSANKINIISKQN